jgi:amidophosphoribosyltransferase
MRPASAPLIDACEFLKASTSRSTLDLIGRKVILKLEGAGSIDLNGYAQCGTEKNLEMVEGIGKHLGLFANLTETLAQ